MLIYNKKRILFLVFATLLPVGIFMLQTSKQNLNMQETVATMSVPVTSKTIVIDAGHGGEDERDCLLKF